MSRKPVVMVVDDEPEICTLLRFVLEKEGYDVAEAGNGQEALDRIAAAGLPDLMILDIMMPVMDGFTLNMKLQADEKTRRIPILVLTAKGQ
jgi:CheY-like chemotaxis protein